MVRERARALYKRLTKAAPRPRRYLRRGISVDAFLAELNGKGVSYAVLRGLDSPSDGEQHAAIDLLISDEDLAVPEGMLSPYVMFATTPAVEIHSVTGLRGTDFHGVPYLLPKLARRLLKNATLVEGKVRVPAPRDHFQALAFEAVYHHGEASGLPESRTVPASVAQPRYDYAGELRRLRKQLGLRVDLTLAGLDRYLAKQGLRPAADLLDRYQTYNPWLRRKLAAERRDIGHLAGLTTFVIRDRAVAYLDEAKTVIERRGFELLHAFHLTDEERARVREGVRGGNWACGPFPKSGGDPAAVIIAYDFRYQPIAAADGQVVNENAATAKAIIRDLIHSRLPRDERFNPLHSTDNGWQSLECLTDVGREGLLADVREQIAAIERKMQLPWPVKRELSVSGRRARVLVVDHPVHGEVVAKVFRPGAARFFARELRARQELGGLPCVPRMLDHGENWILTPLYSNTSAHVLRRLPRSREVQLTYDAMAALVPFVRGLRERNSFLLDLSTHNVISDEREGLLILDFEFLQHYPVPTPTLDRDYTIRGVAPHPSCDAPVFRNPGNWDVLVRSCVFHPVICGLRAEDFFTRPSNRLRTKMAVYQAFWWVAFTAYRLLQIAARRHVVRAGVAMLRTAAQLRFPARRPSVHLNLPSLRPL